MNIFSWLYILFYKPGLLCLQIIKITFHHCLIWTKIYNTQKLIMMLLFCSFQSHKIYWWYHLKFLFVSLSKKHLLNCLNLHLIQLIYLFRLWILWLFFYFLIFSPQLCSFGLIQSFCSIPICLFSFFPLFFRTFQTFSNKILCWKINVLYWIFYIINN